MRRRLSFLALTLLLAIGACAPTVIPAGPAVQAPALTADAIVAADGTRLPLHRWQPVSGAPRAVIVALHGFDAPGRWLAEQGIAAYAYDQRGFGKTASRGYWAGTETLTSDALSAVALIRAGHPGTPVFLLGASMGGAVAMLAVTGATPAPVDGVILSAPAVWGRATMPLYQRLALSLSAHSLPWVTLTGSGLGIQASDNIEMLRALGRDPLIIKETRIDAIHGLVGLMDAALAAAPKLNLPSLILRGANDQLIEDGPTAIMLAELPKDARQPRRIARYRAGWHMLLRDLQAKTVWRDIKGWIEDPAAALGDSSPEKLKAIVRRKYKRDNSR